MDRQKLPVIGALRAAGLLLAALCAGTLQAGVYQWTDAQGRVHFGDRAPAAADAGGGVIEREITAENIPKADFELTITPHGRPLPDGMDKEAGESLRRVVSVYRRTFGLDLRRTVVVKAHLFDDQAALRAWASRITGKPTPEILGIYILSEKQVGVLNREDAPEETLRTLVHESNHVILAQMSPNAPLWLHEGLSQYFEGIETRSEKVVVNPDLEKDAIIRLMIAGKNLVHLRDYLAIPPDRWQQMALEEGNPVPYVVGWSLASFLMSQPFKRQLLGGMMQDLEKANVAPDLDVFARRYPGGLSMLDYDWFRWAMQPAQAHVLD